MTANDLREMLANPLVIDRVTVVCRHPNGDKSECNMDTLLLLYIVVKMDPSEHLHVDIEDSKIVFNLPMMG